MAETKTVNLEVNSNIAQTEQAVTSLRSELRKAQADVAAMSDKFGVTSKEAIEAAKRAADLKDRIGDAKALTDAFNPDAKFKALAGAANIAAGALSGFEGIMGLIGVESKEAQQAILKVQSALALSQGLNVLQEIPDTFKNIKAVAIDAFKGIKTAIGSTGIGLLVVALGTVYAYWDDIKAAVSGVSIEQKKLNAESKKNLAQEQEKLKAIGSQDEILKLQGKSEREILKMKLAQTNETIAAAKIDLQRIETTTKQQQKAEEQNYKSLKSALDFIYTPQRVLFEYGAKAINKFIELINKIPGVEIKARIDEKFAENTVDYITKLGFNPEKTRIEGEKTIKEAKLKLQELSNERAGYQNKINDIDKQAGKEAAQIAEDNAKALEESRKRSREDDEAIRNEIQQAISDAQEKQSEFLISAQEAEERAVKDKYFRLIEYAKQYGLDTKDLEIAQANELNDIRLKNQEKQKQDQKAIDDKQLADAKAVADAKVAIQLQGLNALGDLVGLAKSIGEKNKGLQKAALIAESAIGISKIVINTQAANSAARLKYSLLPGGAALAAAEILLNKVSAGIGIAANIAATAKGLTALGGGGAGGGGGAENSTGGGGGAAPSFNVVGNSGVNQLAETMQGRSAQAPIQAYVVANDVTTAQGLNRNIVTNASLG
jgi:hypothetical protein